MKTVISILSIVILAACAATSPEILKVQQPAAVEESEGLTWESKIDPYDFQDESKWQFEDAEVHPDSVVCTLERIGEGEPTHAFILVSLAGPILSYCYLEDGDLKFFAIDMTKNGYFLFGLPEHEHDVLERLLKEEDAKHGKKGI